MHHPNGTYRIFRLFHTRKAASFRGSGTASAVVIVNIIMVEAKRIGTSGKHFPTKTKRNVGQVKRKRESDNVRSLIIKQVRVPQLKSQVNQPPKTLNFLAEAPNCN